MPLIKNNQIAVDAWIFCDDDAPLDEGDIVVSFERWTLERAALLQRDGRVGVRLKSDQSPSLLAEDLPALALIAIEFPAFKDGRGYSYARLLRERYGFEGELRAVGDVLRDQAFFLQRCGFDAFETAQETDLEGWNASLREFSAVYQPSHDGQPTVIEQRHMHQVAAE